MEIKELIGKTLTAVNVDGDKESIQFVTDDGKIFRMWHSQDCCESVNIEDIAGDLSDLVGSPILSAEESESHNGEPWPDGVPVPEYRDDSWTWTFYRISTNKGTVVIRWYGSSHGYYSESVEFAEV